jgi:hypothetical protein
LMRRIVNQMIDFLADGLIDLAAKSKGHAHFVNLRGTIGTRDYLLWDVLQAGIGKHAH